MSRKFSWRPMFGALAIAAAVEAAFARVLDSDPDDAEAYAQRAEARMGLEQYEEALEDSRRALQLSPGDIDALRTRGGAQVALGRYTQGLDDLNRVPPNERDAETHFLRGLAWLALDRPRRAVRDFTAAIRLDAEPVRAVRACLREHLGVLGPLGLQSVPQVLAPFGQFDPTGFDRVGAAEIPGE